MNYLRLILNGSNCLQYGALSHMHSAKAFRNYVKKYVQIQFQFFFLIAKLHQKLSVYWTKSN
jgi:hypothetical protein